MQGLPIQSVAIIGAGTQGRQFALRCASAGLDVILEDVMPARLRRAEEDLAALPGAAARLRFSLTVEEAVRNADLVVDFVPDELESKLEIFCMVDRMAPPRTTLLTPTETLSISDLASCTYRPERCFAIRGGLESGPTARLIAPPVAASEETARVAAFLSAIGLANTTELDAQPPMLVRTYL